MAIALAFLMRYWRDTLIGVLLIGLLLAWHSHNVALVERGKALERLRVSDSTIVVLQNQKARIDTVYRRDTMRLREVSANTAALRDTLFKNIHDTTVVLRYVKSSDSTIQTCKETLQTCEQAKAILTQERDTWKAKALTIPVARPSGSHWRSNLLWGTIGAAVGYFAHR
jgi:hypothetical protein